MQTLLERQANNRRKLKNFLLTAVLILAGLYIIWQVIFPNYSHSYRLTIEVETPDGLKAASSVINPTAKRQPKILTDRSISGKLYGEATYLDLGHGKNVVAILSRGPDAMDESAPSRLAMEVFGPGRCERRCDWSQMQRMTGERDVLPEQLPTLVTFTDPSDPKTARVIEPSEFEAVFGRGYRFNRAWIEMTHESVTRNIKDRLPWLVGFKGVTGGQNFRDIENPGRNLYASHFSRG